MRTQIRLFALLSCTNLCVANESFAFWDQSHQLIGEIASERVSPKTKEEINRLLKVVVSKPGSDELARNSATMETAASWADNIKSYKDSDNYAACHYTDVEVTREMIGKDINNDEIYNRLKETLAKNKVNSVICLKKAIKTLLTPTEADLNKAIALRMVLHIVGDIGQPLHNAALVEGSFADAGGNNVKFDKPVSFVNIDGSTSVANNLHKLWDGSLNVYFQFAYEPERTKKGLYNSDEINAVKRDAQSVLRFKDFNFLSNNMTTDSNESSIEGWVVDSYKTAVKYVYTDLKFGSQDFSSQSVVATSFKLNWKMYHDDRADVVENQVKKSGIRLYMVLNEIFDPSKSFNQYKTLVENIQKDSSIPVFSKK